jgi:FkbM family methyltransferase
MLLNFKDLLKNYRIEPKGLLHGGANEGQEMELYNEIGIKPVYWVEAIPSVYDKLSEKCKLYEQNYALKACLSNVDGEIVTFNISNNDSQSSSFLELGEHAIIHPEVKYIDKFETTTTRLDTLFKDIDLSGFVMNLDLQGAEYLALQGIGNRLGEFSALYLEVNNKETYKGCATVDVIDDYVSKHGFRRVQTTMFIGDCWADAFYVKW